MHDDPPGLFDVERPPASPRPPRISDDEPGPPLPPVPTWDDILASVRPAAPADRPALDGPRDGATYDDALDRGRLSNQCEAVARAMADGQWHTLARLSAQVAAPQASVSARIRDLRKPRFGSRVIERRRMPGGNGLHEYRLDPDARAEPPSPDPTLGHAVLVTAVADDANPSVRFLLMACQHCDWSYLPGLSATVEQLNDALKRHP